MLIKRFFFAISMKELYTKEYGHRQGGTNGFFGLRNNARVRYFVDWIKPARGESILEVGCNRGLLLRALKAQGALVYGIDINRGIVDELELPFIKYGAVENIPYAPASFDKVIASEILEHVENPRVAIKEIERVVKPGGRVFVTYPIEQIRGIGALADSIAVFGTLHHCRLLHRTKFSIKTLDSIIEGTKLKRETDWVRFIYWPLRFVELKKTI